MSISSEGTAWVTATACGVAALDPENEPSDVGVIGVNVAEMGKGDAGQDARVVVTSLAYWAICAYVGATTMLAGSLDI